ncbi:hypothetical protein W97_01403 [Coniosporium apollinis CBS 100218]|uniref:Enoyl reductase (ER) domain-containing protein n=1 Tax=Coniosporium apollinis (strain CBS 100218) TaxID=1168221 RepID=R7YJY2_CONA1|nr:uncharacterized protein W97_01403 [Coniosporium apollinis CBS 100218]EON62183.1 hypothetical protein W97_01403 [Coniosporium apollinis CBS 100218]
MAEMRAIAISKYGGIDNLVAIKVPKPADPQGHDVLVKVKATSLNPFDTKVRAGIYDDYPDYYSRAPPLPQILGSDGSGTVEAVGPEVSSFKPGDDVFYSGDPIKPGANAEYQLVDSRSVALKPKKLDYVEAASMPVAWMTAWEALVERLGIQEGEEAGIVIVNGAGGVGSIASQVARHILRLPVVVTTTSRPETTEFSRAMGATHTVNHREDIPAQVRDLNLTVPLKYVFITHSTSQYLEPAAAVCAPLGKVCSIVQTKEFPMYGTEFMAKSLTFVWELLGSEAWYGIETDSYGKMLSRLAELIDSGTIKCHLKQRLRLDLGGLRKAHEMIESGSVIGKVGLGIDIDGMSAEEAFT